MPDPSQTFKDSLDSAYSKHPEAHKDLLKYKSMVGETEKLKGGLSDKMTLRDLAKHHTKKGGDVEATYEKLKKQLKMGMTTEKEHTEDIKKAREIAMDHLYEDPSYYSKLKKMEAQEATTTASSGQYSAPLFSKMETKEATDTGSVGAYETPVAWAKNSKEWRGGKKPMYPGGKFVKVKKECKTYPYCNQGDIKALKIYEGKIEEISEKYNIDADDIRYMFLESMRNDNSDIYSKGLDMDLDKFIDDVISEEISKKSEEMTERTIKEKLVGNQKKLDKNKNNELDAQDFKMLRKSKHKKDETKEAIYTKNEMGEANKKKKSISTGNGIPEGEDWDLWRIIPLSNLRDIKKKMENKVEDGGKLSKDDKKLLQRVNFVLRARKVNENKIISLKESELIDLIEELMIEEKIEKKNETKEALDRRAEFFGEMDEAKKEKKWIQKAVKRPGALHKHFGIPEGEKIPKSKLMKLKKQLSAKAEGDKKLSAADSRLLKQVNFALNVGSLKENVQRITESELVDMIYEALIEEKKTSRRDREPEGLRVTNRMLGISGKENKKSLADVGKKMKAYVGEKYKENPESFPDRNGGEREGYTASNAVEEYISSFVPGMQNLVYSEIEPNEDWVGKNIEGSSTTGNNPEWGNAVKTDLGKKVNKIRKDNLYGKEQQNGSYKRYPQPVDVTGKAKKEGGLAKFFSKNESTDSNDSLINEEIKKMNHLVGYNKKTQ